MPLDSFYTLLKTSENLRFSNVFRGDWKRPVAWNGLNIILDLFAFTITYHNRFVVISLKNCIYTELFKNCKRSQFSFSTCNEDLNNNTSSQSSLHKKRSFPLRIPSVNMTFTEEILNGKFLFCMCNASSYSCPPYTILLSENIVGKTTVWTYNHFTNIFVDRCIHLLKYLLMLLNCFIV